MGVAPGEMNCRNCGRMGFEEEEGLVFKEVANRLRKLRVSLSFMNQQKFLGRNFYIESYIPRR